MAIYDFKCKQCGLIIEDVIMPMTHEKEDLPFHCEERMRYHITSVPMVHWKDYDLPDGGFVAHSHPDRPVITSKKQNKDFMERNNLIDANEVFSPPTREEEVKERADVQKSIAAITPTETQKAQLKADGILDIVKGD
jgi:hypothetical protein